MSELHITREMLRAVTRGDVPSQKLIELGWKHLASECPICDEEFQAWRRDLEFSSVHSSAFKVMPALLERHGSQEETRRKAAERDFRELIRVPQAARLEKVERSLTRFRGTLLARRLLAESKDRLTKDADRSDELAAVAELVLLRTAESPGLADLKALACVYRANVARLRGRPDEARERFRRARSVIRMERATDPLTTAEADSCEGVLALDLRQFEEAEGLLNRSVFLYLLAGARPEAALPLITLGRCCHEQGRFVGAVEMTRQALTMIDPRRDRRLLLSAHFNIAVYLCDAGQYSDAAEALSENRELFQEEVQREALAALLVFEEAARKEQLTAEAVQTLVALLKRAR